MGDLDDFFASDGEITCDVRINPTPLTEDNRKGISLSSPPYLDGSTVLQKDKERNESIRWVTNLGNAELAPLYEEKNASINILSAVARIKVNRIFISVLPSRKASLYTILSKLEETLTASLLLLSFLSRQPTHWYEAEVTFTNSRSGRTRVAMAKYEPWPEYDYSKVVNHSPDKIPVELEALRDDGLFQVLLNRYESSEVRQSISQVILYLLASHEPNYLEVRLGIIYAALESLVSALSKEDKLLKSNDFKGFSRHLKNYIYKYFEEKGKDREVSEGIIKKLSELQRPAFLNRLTSLLQSYGLDRLYLKHEDRRGPILEALPDILKRRNHYIHRGEIDTHAHYADFYILQELIELWVLKLLDCPSEAINQDGYSYVNPSGDKFRHTVRVNFANLLPRYNSSFRSITDINGKTSGKTSKE